MKSNIKSTKFPNKNEIKEWKGSWKVSINELLANVFALWTLMNAEYFEQVKNDENSKTYLFTPHAA